MSSSKLALITILILLSYTAKATIYTGSVEVATCSVDIELDSSTSGVTLTIAGPDGVWFGLAFGTRYMATEPWTIVVDGSGGLTEHIIGEHSAGYSISNCLTEVSNTVDSGIRTVVVTRQFKESTTEYYTFGVDYSTGDYVIMAYGNTADFGYHAAQGSGWLPWDAEGDEEEADEEEAVEEEEEGTEEEDEEEAEEETEEEAEEEAEEEGQEEAEEEEGSSEEEDSEEETDEEETDEEETDEEETDEEESTDDDSKSGSTTISNVKIELDLDDSGGDGNAKITLTGPEDNWFGVGFDAQYMSDEPYTLVVLGDGTVDEYKLGHHAAGTKLSSTVTVVSSTKSDSQRTVVLTRALTGTSDDYYTFSADDDVNLIAAYGDTSDFAHHAGASAGKLTFGSDGDGGDSASKLQINLAAIFLLLAMILRY